MVILRLLLGICEAAFGPGVPFYLSFFYKRDELALRTGLFISAAPLATSFAASLAWAITKTSRYIPITPWRMLFLVEGFPSVIIAVFAWFYIPDSPETAVYLSPRERRIANLRLRKEKEVHKDGSTKKGLNFTEILQTLIDPKAYVTAVSPSVCNCMKFSFAAFYGALVRLHMWVDWSVCSVFGSNLLFNRVADVFYRSCFSVVMSHSARCRYSCQLSLKSKFCFKYVHPCKVLEAVDNKVSKFEEFTVPKD